MAIRKKFLNRISVYTTISSVVKCSHRMPVARTTAAATGFAYIPAIAPHVSFHPGNFNITRWHDRCSIRARNGYWQLIVCARFQFDRKRFTVEIRRALYACRFLVAWLWRRAVCHGAHDARRHDLLCLLLLGAGAVLVAREDGLVDGALELVRDLLPLLVDPLDALPVKDHRA